MLGASAGSCRSGSALGVTLGETEGETDGDAGSEVAAVAVVGGSETSASSQATTSAEQHRRNVSNDARTRACYRPPSRRMPRVATLAPRPAADSQVTLIQLMEITDANLAGFVHGGVIMKLVDTAAGLAAIKHAGGMCVTVSMDEMSFLAPVHVGDTVTVRASVNDVGTTSLEVGVRVESEDLRTGERTHTSSAYLVFVALDDEGTPRAVPPLVATTPTEQRRQHEAKMRREARLAHRKAIEELRRARK
jgi:uncharacterized protein (TIGR00369 family)